jgi:putative spermidine/putrescine transport system ATP-binding protein
MTHLVIEGLTKRYGGQLAVDDLSLTVERGEFISLLGPSGCGKTTTLQMIAGFVEASNGRILLDGADLASVPPSKRGLGIVFQSYALFPHMNVAQNIAFGLEMRGIDRTERDKRTADVMKLVGLEGFAERFPRRMSGGQQQRVALARALVIKPALSCSTSRSPISTPSCARRCRASSGRSSAASAPRRSSSRMTRTRPWRCRTGSW